MFPPAKPLALAIPLASKKYPGQFALIDPDDYEIVKDYSWRVVKGRGSDVLYAHGYGNGHWVTMHKLITGFDQTDHKDRNGLNNQRHNLRAANGTQPFSR